MVKYRAVMATQSETNQFRNAGSFSGISTELDYLTQDPLVKIQRGPNSRGKDAIHLSVSSLDKNLFCWSGRASNGMYYHYSDVMKMVEDTGE